jgi:small subunit ribosomal protein S1
MEQAQQQEKDAARKEARVEAEKTNKAVKNIQTKVEKATLGDLGALASIRDKLQQQEGDDNK